MSCKPGDACWIRAGDPLFMHRMSTDLPDDQMRKALCGDESIGWRCVDGDGVNLTVCPRCAAAGPVTQPMDLLPTRRG